MPDIYRCAKWVLIWLDLSSRAAFRNFETEKEHYAPPEERKLFKSNYKPATRAAVQILRNQYFTALGRQRKTTSRTLRLFCGSHWICWEDLKEVITAFGSGSTRQIHQPLRLFHDRPNHPRLASVQKRNLGDCIMLYGHLSCEDNRDKVYGLLGLLEAGEMATVDYRKSVKDILLDVVKVVLMEQELTSGILHLAYLAHLATTIALPMRELRPLKSFLEDLCYKLMRGLSVCVQLIIAVRAVSMSAKRKS